ncbi:MAG TPA: DNRLRE domain-containing protein [Chitinophagaceae bacterium]|nr:DNRLRE domain-containing protein [Chitinophagaceae bacterium]
MRQINSKYFFFAICLFAFISCQKQTNEILPAPENSVPLVDAGSFQTITLPTDSIILTGSASDSDGHIVAYLWSQVSGPAASVIVNPGSTSTKVKGLRQGSYLFQLMAVDDNGATGVDTASVLVNPSPIQTLTLQPTNNPNEFLLVNNNGINQSGSGSPDIPVEAWTSGGNPYTVRSLLKFDLSTIPSTATIISANLYLYSYPSPTLNGNFTDANFGTANSFTVQQVTGNWSPGSTTWFNQPAATTTNQVVVPHTTQSTLDLDLDVKNMISSMVNTNNYGFLLKLQAETIYNSRIFVSSYNTTYPTKRPKLVIVYQ